MDDWQHIQTVNPIWESANIFRSLFETIKGDLLGGKVRSVHWIYATIVYRLFSNAPFLIYIFIFLAQMALLPLWGLIFHRMFAKDGPVSRDALFIFPLSFFVFTPFWNNFMYISVQEKLVFFFSTLAIYFFMLTYDKHKAGYTFLSLLFALLCLFSKPTGIYIILAFLGCSAIYLLIYRRNLLLPAVYLLACISMLFGYYLMIKAVVNPGGYSSRYMDNLSITAILNQLKQSSIVVKALFAAALILLPVYLSLIKKKYFSFPSLLIPFGFISYLFVILPWGTSNYLLGPLAPFALGIFFPVYLLLINKLKKFKLDYLPSLTIILLVALVFAQVIVPRINKIAEIKHVEAEIIKLKNSGVNPRFYFPPYYSETCFALSKFTDTEIIYLSEPVLDAKMLSKGDSYLIYRDESSNISLKDARIAGVVFKNKTWKIFKLEKSSGTEMLDIKFPKTILQKAIKLFSRS